MTSPVEILTPDLTAQGNLYDLQGNAIVLNQGAQNNITGGFEVVFQTPVQADKILIKNTSLEGLAVWYKAQSTDAYSLLEDTVFSASGKDRLVTFPQTLGAAALKFVFTAQTQQYFYSFLLLKSLLVLDKALSSFRPSQYILGGSHYTVGGNLIVWREYCKNGGTLTLENMPFETKNSLKEICAENIFLTFLFYGSLDLAPSGVYGLIKPLKTEFDRSLVLWRAELELAEQ